MQLLSYLPAFISQDELSSYWDRFIKDDEFICNEKNLEPILENLLAIGLVKRQMKPEKRIHVNESVKKYLRVAISNTTYHIKVMVILAKHFRDRVTQFYLSYKHDDTDNDPHNSEDTKMLNLLLDNDILVFFSVDCLQKWK
jgi:hypothetical protein